MIKGLDYEKLIPSKVVRDNMDFDGLDDIAVVTLIENKYFKRAEKMAMFELVMNQTDNEALKNEINNYLNDEKCIYDELTQKNDGNYIYLLIVEEEKDEYCNGCFYEYEDAYRYAVHTKECCRIEKRPILGMGDNKAYSDSELGEKPLIKSRHYEDGDELGTIKLDENGEVKYIWLSDYSSEKESWERLLHSYVDIYNPFERGDIVTKAEDKSYVGVVATTKKVWDEEMDRIKKHNHDDMFNLDFTDEVIIVDEVSNEGYVGHNHICPTELEFANEEDYDHEHYQFMKAVSNMEKNDYSIQWMMMCYDKLVARREH